MTYLPDVNVWVALAVGDHVHHSAAKSWLDSCEADAIAFCRVTEMGLLRLLTNAQVMHQDVLPPRRAWSVRDAFFLDDRLIFLAEPPNIEVYWREFSKHRNSGPNYWTDAYLASFCRAAECTLVSFDRAITQHKGIRVHLLQRDSTNE